jgi:flagellar operon protein
MKVSDLQLNQRIYPLDPSRVEKQTSKDSRSGIVGDKPNFGQILEKTIQDAKTEIRFSSHAIDRIQQRSVALSVDELSRLSDGMKQVQEKGAQNSLILVGDTAFVVSIKNNTVITALDSAQQANRIFTNIDSVAIV